MKATTLGFLLLWFLGLIFLVQKFYWGESLELSLVHIIWPLFGGVIVGLVIFKKSN
jgi:hypothetical protein